jgi:L-alanine-DL-glutamate epimerase-like enolase superfamily enzyme
LPNGRETNRVPVSVPLEYRPDRGGPARDLVREPLALEDGHIRIPEKSGPGVELNEAAFAGKPLRAWHRPFIIEAGGNIGYE